MHKAIHDMLLYCIAKIEAHLNKLISIVQPLFLKIINLKSQKYKSYVFLDKLEHLLFPDELNSVKVLDFGQIWLLFWENPVSQNTPFFDFVFSLEQ